MLWKRGENAQVTTRSISILGATGSIGASTLDLIRRNRGDWRVVALTANEHAVELARLAREFGAEVAVVADEGRLPELREALAGSGIEAAAGAGALVEAAARGADVTIAAIVGCAGLAPTMAAIERGGIVALANKEALVTAGGLMTGAAERSGATILPIDSEHNAIFQCLAGQDCHGVSRLILTASGGPFRLMAMEGMRVVTPRQAVAHPNWTMGAKISVDSATMMNKGLELIEAHHLFGLSSERIDILVHPQSVVHSMVEFADGSVLAQMGSPDMRIPIAHALAWPERMETPAERLDLAKIGRLDFEEPDVERFPSLRLAREALESGTLAPIVLNAANEIAVAAFLAGRIGFLDIGRTVEEALARVTADEPRSIADVIEIDRIGRPTATMLLERIAA
jgi:1-deoxy-D-xylulose-5-phosphate reductoisomerase